MNITALIKQKLNEIEKIENVQIIMAVESGSRAWGFASPDSDYDVRFIYVREAEDYLKLKPLRDVIEWQLDEVYDISGWDLKKALLQARVWQGCSANKIHRNLARFSWKRSAEAIWKEMEKDERSGMERLGNRVQDVNKCIQTTSHPIPGKIMYAP